MWVTSRRLRAPSPSQSPSPGTLGWTQPGGRGAVAYPTPSLETGRGRAPRQEVWQQPWGKEPGPASVTRFLRDLAPRPGSGRALRLGRGTWARDPAEVGVRRTCPASEASGYRPPPAMVQPAVPTGDLGGRQLGKDSISPGGERTRERVLVAVATRWSRHSAGGRGGPRSLPLDAHIRAQEGVGPALSLGPKLGAGSPGICQVPGRARAPDG